MPSVFLDIHVAVGLREAARAAGLTDEQFAERALRMLAATYGVEIAPSKPSPVQAFEAATKPRSKGGRPRKPATWAMEYDTPNGDFPRVCPVCGRSFRADNERTVYCSDTCWHRANNTREYQKRKKRGT